MMPAEWMPALNKCWYAYRIIEIRRKYNLTIDRREAEFLERVLSSCTSNEMVIHPCESVQSEDELAATLSNQEPTGNIECAESLGRQSKWKDYLRRGTAPWHRASTALNTRLIATCVTGTGMVWFASNRTRKCRPHLCWNLERQR